jgi:hypothetical protein
MKYFFHLTWAVASGLSPDDANKMQNEGVLKGPFMKKTKIIVNSIVDEPFQA